MKKILAMIGVALAATLSCAPSIQAAESPFYGLLRARDLTPFGFLRLDMRPAHAISIDKGRFAIETELGYQNTWALSAEVEDYLTALESQGRRDLGPADLQAICLIRAASWTARSKASMTHSDSVRSAAQRRAATTSTSFTT